MQRMVKGPQAECMSSADATRVYFIVVAPGPGTGLYTDPSEALELASRGSEGNIFNTPVVSQPRAEVRAQPCLHEEHRQPSVAAPRDRGRVFWG